VVCKFLGWTSFYDKLVLMAESEQIHFETSSYLAKHANLLE
jgi:hypothetical protein